MKYNWIVRIKPYNVHGELVDIHRKFCIPDHLISDAAIMFSNVQRMPEEMSQAVIKKSTASDFREKVLEGIDPIKRIALGAAQAGYNKRRKEK